MPWTSPVYPQVPGSVPPPDALHPAKCDPYTHRLSAHSTGLTYCPLPMCTYCPQTKCPLPILGPSAHAAPTGTLHLCPSQDWPLTLPHSQSPRSHGCHYPAICPTLRLSPECLFCLFLCLSLSPGRLCCDGQGSKCPK